MVAGVVHQQRVAWVECSRILGRRTGPPQVAFAAVNVPSGRAAGIFELAEGGKGVWGANQIRLDLFLRCRRAWVNSRQG
jgi:hypothetical protein